VLLAEAGLLDGRKATTHWLAEPLFRARYPSVRLVSHQIIVDEGRIITCGGAFSFLHLLMYLAEKHYGAEVAAAAHRMFLIDVNKSPQPAYAIFSAQKTHGDEAIHKAQELIEGGLGKALSVPVLAESVSLSRRHFVRRFKQATGNTPLEYVQRARVEAAKKALFESRRPFDDIAWSVGYTDTPGFRRVFIRHTGLTPSEYRRRFNAAYAPAARPYA
jgi:transcriptional regulator GlxA family with amidase domain